MPSPAFLSPVNPRPPLQSRQLACRNLAITLSGEPRIVGILNLTPDSFYDGGRFASRETALAQARRLIAEGAAMLDIGGQSTRPGFDEISAQEEIDRVVPVIGTLAAESRVPLSIDTYKPAVARAALQAGAHVLNDVHGLQRAPELAELAAEFGCALIVMHQEAGFPESSDDPIAIIKRFFDRSLAIAERAGVARDRVVLDPGIGFAKTPAQNLALIGRIGELGSLGCPLLLGASRKSTLGRVLGGLPVEARLEATLATTALAVWQGIEFIRVHDVEANVRAAKVAHAVREAAGK